jgi:hypothetical protein
VDLDGGPPRRLTSHPGDELAPSVSRDGQWVYFASSHEGEWQLHKVGLTTGEERRVTEGGGYAALESPDGRFVYHTRIDRFGIWRMPAAGGPSERVTAALRPEDWASWGITDAGLYWLAPGAGDADPTLALLRPGAAAPETLASVHLLAWTGIELTPDARELLYSRLDHRDSNVVLLSLRPAP